MGNALKCKMLVSNNTIILRNLNVKLDWPYLFCLIIVLSKSKSELELTRQKKLQKFLFHHKLFNTHSDVFKVI